MAKASQKKIDYNNKYNSQNYVRINLSVKPEDADFIKASAKAAVKAAKAVAGGEDGGTCNFDAPMIPATKWNQKLIELSAKEAGIRVFDTRICRHKYYIFSIPFCGQGNARTRQAEAMAQTMKAAGYDASVFYQID